MPTSWNFYYFYEKVMCFKVNDMATLIVEGGWASDDNNSSLLEQTHAISGTIFYFEDSSEILK